MTTPEAEEPPRPPSLGDFEGATDDEIANLPPDMRRLLQADRAATALAKVDLITADLTKEIALTEFDKREWGPGAWQDEPDLLMWLAKTPPHYRCQVARSYFGSLCGYVAIPPGHPAHGLHQSQLGNLPSHRGLTWSGPATGDHWVVGFDCGHAFDIQPATDFRLRRQQITPPHEDPWVRSFDADMPAFMQYRYRDLPYVRGLVEALAEALSAWATTGKPPPDDDPLTPLELEP